MKIGIFDSGIGGTTVMQAIKDVLPDEEYLYFADTKNCPYGSKPFNELYSIVSANVIHLADQGAKIIVVACNTATTQCIKKLRQDYPALTFVGVEPAIRLAAKSNASKILVLATPGTINSERTKLLVEENRRPHQTIKLLACPGLAETIEHNLTKNPEKIHQKLEELLTDLNFNPDTIVLGCTHYSLIKPEIQAFFPKAQLIDGNPSIAHRVQQILNNQSET